MGFVQEVGFDSDNGCATNHHYSIFFVHEEGTASSFQGVQDVIMKRGLFSSIDTERQSKKKFFRERKK
jgi:hypothetical protein